MNPRNQPGDVIKQANRKTVRNITEIENWIYTDRGELLC
jgi:hypothetical protein